MKTGGRCGGRRPGDLARDGCERCAGSQDGRERGRWKDCQPGTRGDGAPTRAPLRLHGRGAGKARRPARGARRARWRGRRGASVPAEEAYRPGAGRVRGPGSRPTPGLGSGESILGGRRRAETVPRGTDPSRRGRAPVPVVEAGRHGGRDAVVALRRGCSGRVCPGSVPRCSPCPRCRLRPSSGVSPGWVKMYPGLTTRGAPGVDRTAKRK